MKFDPSEQVQEEVDKYVLSMNKEAIPDVDNMLETVNDLLNFIESPGMVKLEASDKKKFEEVTYSKYNDSLSVSIIRMMLEDDRYDNLVKLMDMFESLQNVKNGKIDVQSAFKNFREGKNEEYIYPTFGGKKGFEDKMKELGAVNKTRKTN